jgi:hypothetical protein
MFAAEFAAISGVSASMLATSRARALYAVESRDDVG